MKTIDDLPNKHRNKILSISDERNNGDGWWIYLHKEYADFSFDPLYPMRQIHDQKLSDCIKRLKKDVRKVTEDDYKKFPQLER